MLVALPVVGTRAVQAQERWPVRAAGDEVKGTDQRDRRRLCPRAATEQGANARGSNRSNCEDYAGFVRGRCGGQAGELHEARLKVPLSETVSGRWLPGQSRQR